MSELKKFIFKDLAVRGAIVRLTDVWQEILSRQQQSAEIEQARQNFFLPPVRELMGEMTAAAVLLHTTIKFDGTLILQIQGDGPVKLAVAEAQGDMGVRTTATIQGEVPALGGIEALCNVNGRGRCAITLDPRNRPQGQHPYQGVVPLANAEGVSYTALCDVLEGYMQQSEQLPTRILLTADQHTAAGLILQRLPGEGGKVIPELQQQEVNETVDEAFQRIAILAKSLKREELLTLSNQEILHRLFWQEEVELFDDVAQPYFHCTCSRERVSEMLKSLGEEEIESILQEKGKAEVTCDFCGAVYQFDAVDASALFSQNHAQSSATSTLQ